MQKAGKIIEVGIVPPLGNGTVDFLQRLINDIIKGDVTDIAIAVCERGGTRTYHSAPINPDRLIGLTAILNKRLIDEWEEEEDDIGDVS